jgi:hypothetical protein
MVRIAEHSVDTVVSLHGDGYHGVAIKGDGL